jgi:hypothetical protein
MVRGSTAPDGTHIILSRDMWKEFVARLKHDDFVNPTRLCFSINPIESARNSWVGRYSQAAAQASEARLGAGTAGTALL